VGDRAFFGLDGISPTERAAVDGLLRLLAEGRDMPGGSWVRIPMNGDVRMVRVSPQLHAVFRYHQHPARIELVDFVRPEEIAAFRAADLRNGEAA